MDRVRARGLASQLLFQWGLHRWRCILKPLKGRLGQCEYRNQVIVLSEHYVENNEEWKIKDTILHEIAHALAGPDVASHGPEWKTMARKVGAIPKACSKTADMPEGRYQALCPSCKKLYHRHRKPKSSALGGYHCLKCGPERGRLNFMFACAT